MGFFKRLKRSEDAQAMVEYVILLSMISVVVIVVLVSIGGKVEDTFGGLLGDGENPYTEDDIQGLVDEGYIPVANDRELQAIAADNEDLILFGEGTIWEGEYNRGLDKNYVQVEDIDLSLNDSFNPIDSFSGVYDGGKLTINNLTIEDSGGNYIGLFGEITGSTIENVGLVNVNINGRRNVGGLVGYTLNSSKISNSYVIGSVSGVSSVGGIVGFNDGGSTIQRSYVIGDVSAEDAFVGGISSANDESSIISDSYIVGDVYCEDGFIGGITGYNDEGSKIINSYIEGNVISASKSFFSGYIGGIAGYNDGGSEIVRSYIIGDIEGLNYIGGIAGYNDSSKIYKSYVKGNVVTKPDSSLVGGIVGYNEGESAIISDSYIVGDVKGNSEVGGIAGYNDKLSLIDKSYVIGDIEGYGDNVGGISGYNSNQATVINSYVIGNVRGKEYVGGIVGKNCKNSRSCSITELGTVENSFAYGDVIGEKNLGGVTGKRIDGDKIDNSYFNKDLYKGEYGASHGRTTDELKDISTFIGWDFDSIWMLKGDYPTLQ